MTPSGPLLRQPRRHASPWLVALAALAVMLIAALVADGARSPRPRELIAFIRGDGAVWVVRGDGTGARVLTRHVRAGELAWSPDGRRLALVTHPSYDQQAISVMDANGKHETRLALFTAAASDRLALFAAAAGDLRFPRSPTWSPDGATIAFTAYSDGDRDRDIWVVDADGNNMRRLARTPDHSETQVDWSPTGGTLAVTDGGYVPDIWVTTTNGEYLRILTPGRLEGFDPEWSPDGRRIAFTRWQGADRSTEIVVVDAGGRSRVRLTRNDVSDRHPTWSPDGRRIVFIRSLGAPAGEIRVMNADGTKATRLTAKAGMEPTWQPVVPR